MMEPSSRHGSNKSRSRSRGKGRKHNKENAEAVHAHESGGYHNEKKTFSAKNTRKAATESGNNSASVSHQMWRKDNEEKLRKADMVFQKSAKKRAEAMKMIEKEMADTSARQEKVDHKLKERIEETVFWTEEVESEIIRWNDEKDKLAEIKTKLDHALGQTSKPSKVADKCLRLREDRIGEDKVVDLVEESLIRELENVKMWQMRFKTAIEQVEFQQKENHTNMRLLSRDLGVKERSVVIDSNCCQLNSQYNKLTKHTGADMVFAPASWEKSTKSMIASSRASRDNSQQLRSDIETLIRTACTDLSKHWKRTNADLRDQQDILRHSLASLQDRLASTVQEIAAQSQEMDKLKETIQSKAGPLKLAQTRLNMRTQKIRRTKQVRVEDDVDSPQAELVAEVTNILDALQVLNNHLRKAESAVKKLTANKCKLEHNISVKINSINIDVNLLMNREEYPLKLQGNWQKILDESLKQKEDSRKQNCETARSINSGSTDA